MGWLDRFRSRGTPPVRESSTPPPKKGTRHDAVPASPPPPQRVGPGERPQAKSALAPESTSPNRATMYSDGGAAAAFALALQPEPDPSAVRAASQFALGDVIADTYRVTSVLGETAHFWACRADHLLWGIPVVVKSPRADFLRQTGAARAIATDASRWTGLGLHPHVAYCHQVHTYKGVPLVVIEWLDAGNLRPAIANARTAQLHIGLNLVIQICHGLEHAHGHGLLHGALRPENLVLNREGVLRVTDFWSDVRTVAATQGGSGPGRQRWEQSLGPYIAPERWVGATAPDPRSDVFGLGVCMYEIFCGARPYEIARGPRRAAPEPRGAQTEARLPDRLIALLKRCVDWDQERRPQTVADVCEELCALHLELFGKPSPFARPAPCSSADGWNNQALAALVQGRAADAEVAWQRALAADAYHLEATYNGGVARWRRGELTDDAVVQQVEQASAAASYEWRGSHLLALVHLERGDAPAALPLLERIVPLAGGNSEVAATLARAREQAARMGAVRGLTVHRGFVSDLSMSPDGRRILSAGEDNALKLSDAASGTLLHSLEGHTARPSCVRFSGDGTRALSGGEDCTLRLWDMSTAQCLKTLPTTGPVFSVALSADGNVALSSASSSEKMADDTLLQLWDLKGARCLGRLVGHTRAAKSVGLSADGRKAVTGGDDHSVRVWDLGSLMCRLVLSGHEHHVSAVHLSDNGQFAASGSWDRTVRLWDANTGRCLRVFAGHQGIITSVCVSADGRLVLSGSWDNTVRLWDARSGRCLRTFAGHGSMVTAVTMSADGLTAASASWDRVIRLWPLPSPDETPPPLRLSVRAQQRAVLPVQLQPAELLDEAEGAIKEARWDQALARVRQVRSLDDRRLEARATRLWRALSVVCRRAGLQGATSAVTISTLQPVYGGCLTSDSRWVVTPTRGDTIEVWDVDLERCARTFTGHTNRVLSIAVSRDEAVALSASADRTLRLWDLASGKCLRVLTGHQSVVAAAVLSSDRQWAASAGYDHTVRLWSLSTGECTRILRGHRRQVTAVSISGDERWIVSASLDQTVRLWDATSGEPLQVLSGHTGGVLAAALSGDGTWVLSGARDGHVRLWERTTGKCLQVLEGHDGSVAGVFMTPDDRWGFSASADRTVRVWNLRAGECARVLSDHSDPLTGLSLSRDGTSLLVTTAQPALQIWDLDWELEAPEDAPAS
jgi:WD40 repeat protein